MPRSLDEVSVTEVGQFKECRRQWYLGSYLGYQLKKPDDRLWFGTLIHHALEEYGRSYSMQATIDEFEKEFDSSIVDLQQEYGGLWGWVENDIYAYKPLGVEMLRNYAAFDRGTSLQLRTVSLERRVWVPIRTSTGRATLKSRPRLTARMDRIASEGSDLYLVDYKTGAQVWTQGRGLDLDDQVTGYYYSFWRLTGELFKGVVYETLLKKVPNQPRLLKDGSLSTAKDQLTLHGWYYSKMVELDLTRSGKHIQALNALKVRGWDPFFHREVTSRNLAQIKAYEEHLFYVFKDMLDISKYPEKAYPSPSALHCPRCDFLQVCQAMEDGSDHQHLLGANFKINPDRRW
jgi:hypothetical protein